MKTAEFKSWLDTNYSANSAATHFWCVKRVEEFYGDLDHLIDDGKIEALAQEFNYSTADVREGRPNKTKIPTGSNLYSNLGGFKSAIRCYAKFRGSEAESATEALVETAAASIAQKKADKQFDLEAQLQAALRGELDQLEAGLVAVDGGVERTVASGEIDILARGADDSLVVIELKRGLARRETIGQIMGYIGDLMIEEVGEAIRGIIVAADFDKSCRGATGAISNLSLKTYRFAFAFGDVVGDSIAQETGANS